MEKGWFCLSLEVGNDRSGHCCLAQLLTSLCWKQSPLGSLLVSPRTCAHLFSLVPEMKPQNNERRPFSVSFFSAARPPSHSHLNEVLTKPLKTAKLSLPNLILEALQTPLPHPAHCASPYPSPCPLYGIFFVHNHTTPAVKISSPGPSWVAQLVRALSWYTKAEASILGAHIRSNQ